MHLLHDVTFQYLPAICNRRNFCYSRFEALEFHDWSSSFWYTVIAPPALAWKEAGGQILYVHPDDKVRHELNLRSGLNHPEKRQQIEQGLKIRYPFFRTTKTSRRIGFLSLHLQRKTIWKIEISPDYQYMAKEPLIFHVCSTRTRRDRLFRQKLCTPFHYSRHTSRCQTIQTELISFNRLHIHSFAVPKQKEPFAMPESSENGIETPLRDCFS